MIFIKIKLIFLLTLFFSLYSNAHESFQVSGCPEDGRSQLEEVVTISNGLIKIENILGEKHSFYELAKEKIHYDLYRIVKTIPVDGGYLVYYLDDAHYPPKGKEAIVLLRKYLDEQSIISIKGHIGGDVNSKNCSH